ncbi:hypothetical protein [Caldisalinibacter kiritimatiensis]|uniref:Uncharacterized protein n=1 Tax=Caldisalinibacter kiritimatiensis TaxID=1304284 RepID=R1AT61_9FIRM|nr:hypothetical protein [Caldisalinibacter kiritimatiensis]EOD00323.1 hypothetical protein L21TH_1622 [Caldisalinibacter kiritimatiensis]
MKNDKWVKILLVGAILLFIAQIAKLPVLFALAFPTLIIAWMTLGALRRNEVGKGLKISLICLYAIWIIGFLVLNLMNHSVFNGTALGFMPGTAIMIYIIWLLPFFVGTLMYGIRFDKDYLDEKDIKRFEKKTGETVNLD